MKTAKTFNVSLAGAASLVKTGNGTVTVDDASGIGSFAGKIHVFQGGWSVGTASGFGTAAGATWVYPNGCVLFTDVTVSRSGEVFHLAGTGISDWNGWGAIRFPASSQGEVAMAREPTARAGFSRMMPLCLSGVPTTPTKPASFRPSTSC